MPVITLTPITTWKYILIVPQNESKVHKISLIIPKIKVLLLQTVRQGDTNNSISHFIIIRDTESDSWFYILRKFK